MAMQQQYDHDSLPPVDSHKTRLKYAVDYFCAQLDSQYAKYDRGKVETSIKAIYEYALEGGLK